MTVKFTLQDIPKYETIRKMVHRYTDVDPLVVEAWIIMLRVVSDIFAAGAEHLARYGITDGRFMVLMLLNRYRDDGLSPSELAQKAGVTRATMTGLIDGLERDCMIERKQTPHDRRSISIHLTEKANGFLQNMLPDHFQRISKTMSRLNGQDCRQLIEIMNKINQGIPAIRDP